MPCILNLLLFQQDECVRQVKVNGQDTDVRGIRIEDKTSNIRVSLWRDAASSKVKAGDYIEVTNLTISKFNSEVIAGTTSRTALQVIYHMYTTNEQLYTLYFVHIT